MLSQIGLRERYGSLYERMNEDRNEEVIYGQKKKEHNQLQLKFGVIILQPNPSEDPGDSFSMLQGVWTASSRAGD